MKRPYTQSLFDNLPVKKGIYRRFIKRPMDFVLSLIAITVFSPVLSVIAILIRVKLGSPVTFKQKRPGLNEKIFTLYKFRTMIEARDENDELLPDELRLTNLGKLLRSTSLDELPELWNIIQGDLSIVGPRPLLIKYLPYYTAEERIRHSVRPGLSGLAQISGRNYLNWDSRLQKDIEYVGKVSFLLDIKIIIRTVLKVFKSKNVAVDTNNIEGNFAEIRKSRLSDSKIDESRY